jgi:ABC-type cobalamin/Fe3+-siderophores transport system ATPase subunit
MDKIIVDHLSLRYSDGAESLRDIHFNIPANKVVVLFGPAGGENPRCCARSTA